jgi:hypothetical protein
MYFESCMMTNVQNNTSMLNINIIQNHWVFGLRPSSGILKTTEHKVLETGCFHPQVRGEGKNIF